MMKTHTWFQEPSIITMWTSTLIMLLLLTTLAGTQALVTRGDASFAIIGQHYYLVSKNNSHISIRTNFNISKECDLEFGDKHVGRIQVAGIEQKILLLFRQNSTIIRLLQLDPILCLYHPLTNLETSAVSTLEPQLILVNNTLDIFLRGHENCLPCRFDVNGNRLEVTGQLIQSSSPLLKSFIVKEFTRKNQLRNYAFVANFADGTSLLKIVDHNFSTTKETYFDHRIEALAAYSGATESWIGIIYAGLGSPYERVLALYTSTLDLLFETRVVPDNCFKISDSMLSINSTGHSFVKYVESGPLSSDQQRFIYTVYNSKGQIGDKGNLTQFSRKIKYDWQLFLSNGMFRSALHKYQTTGTDSILWYFH